MAAPREVPPSDQRYKYTSLTSTKGEKFIRLLKIISKPNEPIHCTLQVVDLNTHPIYDCLSYTWGDPIYHELSDPSKIRRVTGDRNKTVKCDDKILPITENLLDVLIQFSHDLASAPANEKDQQPGQRHIWIDAICINQESDPEKNVQVAMMDEIYNSAQRVVVWLGREDEHTLPSLSIISRIKSLPPSSLNATFTDLDSPELGRVFGQPPITLQQWNAYAAFLQRAWFNRVWVIQEAFLAKHLEVHLGPHILSWEHDIFGVSKFLRSSNLGTLLMSLANQAANPNGGATVYVNNNLNNQYTLQSMKTSPKPLNVEKLLAYSRYFNATQAQDHVFGLLGIWKFANGQHELPQEMTPDHSMAVAEVFTQYSWVSIRDTGDLNLLSLVEDASFRKVKDLPSWVPDYSTSFTIHPLQGTPRPSLGKERWNASAGLPFQLPSSIDPKKLPVQGILFDEVAETAATYTQILNENQINSLLSLLANYPNPTYPTGTSPLEAFFHTLIKDTFRDQPAANEARNAFKLFIAERVAYLQDYPLVISESPEINFNEKEYNALLSATKTSLDTLATKYPNSDLIPSWEEIDSIVEVLSPDNPDVKQRDELNRLFDDVMEFFRFAYGCRRLFRTKKGYLGVAAQSLEKNDVVWVLGGCRVPFVLRKVKDGGWKVVGEAFIWGVMGGEVVKNFGLETEKIDLV